MKVPFMDLHAHHEPLRAEYDRAIKAVIDSGAFAGGPFVEKFENEFAAHCQVEHAVGVGSGTEALWIALLALGVGPGDEVITVPMTFIATAEAISFTGAVPVFVDIDEETCTMDPAALEKAVTPRTKAIIPVQLFGQPADMDPIVTFARERGLYVIEDAAQAHGAEYRGRRVGSLADAGCFSFYPGKNLGAFGEGGAVVTGDPELAARMRSLRDHGQARKYHHAVVGWNSRMDGIQAAVLSIKLRDLDGNNEKRRTHAASYGRALAGLDGVGLPTVADDRTHVYHVYAVRVREREELMEYLGARDIGCGIHYPVPVHLQEAYGDLGLGRGSFPVSERCADEFLSLPMFPELSTEQIDAVANAVRDGVQAGALT